MRSFMQHFLSSRRVRATAKRIFPQDDQAQIMAILNEYGTQAHETGRDRVQLVILTLSEGNVDKLRQYTAAAKQDYRDVLWWAESPRDQDSQAEREEVEQILEVFGDEPGEEGTHNT